MPSFECPKCGQPRPAHQSLCRLCQAIERGLIKGLAERDAARLRRELNNTDELTYEEAGTFDEMVEGFVFELEDTPFYRGTTYEGPPIDPQTLLPTYVPNTEPTPVPAPAGLGQGTIGQMRGAIDAERQRAVLAASEEWRKLEEQAIDLHHARQSRATRHDILTAAILGAIGGLAVGVGLAFLIILLVTGASA